MASKTSTASLPLAELPLRQSTLTLLQQRGFVTLGELMESKESGGMGTLAAELHVELPKAMRILREVQQCLTASVTAQIHSQSLQFEGTKGSESASIAPLSEAPFVLTPPRLLTAGELLSSSSLCSISPKTTDNPQPPSGIISFCQSIDKLFFTAGIPLGSVTEIAGLPGVGKTQFAMQLAVNARLPRHLGGVQGQTLYIDAEGSFVPERLHAMAQALLMHTQGTVKRRRASGRDVTVPEYFSSPERILEGIHVFRVHDEASQTTTLYSLPHWIEQLKSPDENSTYEPIPVKLIIIDSIAFHYRAAYGSSQSKSPYLQRTRALSQLAAFLNDVAREHDIAVVCLNQMTTKIAETSDKATNALSHSVPALGETWAHAISTRILLSKDDYHTHDHRTFTIVKSPCMPSGSAVFQVTDFGIRDASQPTCVQSKVADKNDHGEARGSRSRQEGESTIDGGNQFKRLREN